jgi:hypothetical protein
MTQQDGDITTAIKRIADFILATHRCFYHTHGFTMTDNVFKKIHGLTDYGARINCTYYRIKPGQLFLFETVKEMAAGSVVEVRAVVW